MASLKSDIVEKSKSATDSSASSGIEFDDLTVSILLKFVKVLEAAAILVVTWFIVSRVKKYFLKMEVAHQQQRTALNLLEKITTGFIIVIGITLALKVVGLDMTLFVGVVLLGVSYGLKDVIKNYIAGILIFLKAPFRIGDIVKIKKYIGKIEHMELQSTTMQTFDNKSITIYNSDIMTKSIENYSRYPTRRMEINVGLGYGTNTEKAIQVFSKILDNCDKVLKKPKYRIIFDNFNTNGMIFQIKFWVNFPSDILGIKSELAFKIHQSFDEKELLTPFNKGFELEEPYKPTPEQAQRIEEFYKSATMQAVATTSPTATPTTDPTTGAMQPVPEFADIDEPE